MTVESLAVPYGTPEHFALGSIIVSVTVYEKKRINVLHSILIQSVSALGNKVSEIYNSRRSLNVLTYKFITIAYKSELYSVYKI